MKTMGYSSYVTLLKTEFLRKMTDLNLNEAKKLYAQYVSLHYFADKTIDEDWMFDKIVLEATKDKNKALDGKRKLFDIFSLHELQNNNIYLDPKIHLMSSYCRNSSR